MAAKRQDERDSVTERIRTAAIIQRQSTSLRGVARDVGMTPSGLSKFLDGAKPYPHTLSLLRRWYTRDAANRVELGEEDAMIALQVLTAALPEDERRRCTADMLERLRAAYGPEEPGWLRSMARDAAAGGQTT